MSVDALANGSLEERTSPRVPFQGAFWYRDENGERGRAAWCSLGQDGARLRIERYLRPGRRIRLVLEDETPVARIVWCRPAADGTSFMAGVKIFADPDAEFADRTGFDFRSLRFTTA